MIKTTTAAAAAIAGVMLLTITYLAIDIHGLTGAINQDTIQSLLLLAIAVRVTTKP